MCAATPINWVDIYMTFVSANINDPVLSLSNIRRVPLKVISSLYKTVIEYTQKQANVNAYTTAQLAYNFYYFSTSFSGDSKSAQLNSVEFKNFLPYPNAWQSEETNKATLTEKSKKVIQHLINTDSIGVKLASLISPYMK